MQDDGKPCTPQVVVVTGTPEDASLQTWQEMEYEVYLLEYTANNMEGPIEHPFGPVGVIPDKTAPNIPNATIGPISRAACASMMANDHYSIASQTSGDLPGNPIVQAALRNSVSGIYDLLNSGANPLPAVALGGLNPGIPGVALNVAGWDVSSGAVGVAEQVAARVAATNMSRAASASFSDALGYISFAKFGFDALAFAYAYLHDCSQ